MDGCGSISERMERCHFTYLHLLHYSLVKFRRKQEVANNFNEVVESLISYQPSKGLQGKLFAKQAFEEKKSLFLLSSKLTRNAAIQERERGEEKKESRSQSGVAEKTKRAFFTLLTDLFLACLSWARRGQKTSLSITQQRRTFFFTPLPPPKKMFCSSKKIWELSSRKRGGGRGESHQLAPPAVFLSLPPFVHLRSGHRVRLVDQLLGCFVAGFFLGGGGGRGDLSA